ncbi:gamma-carotene 1'-hydroxylase CruF [Gloeomargarita sp.]
MTHRMRMEWLVLMAHGLAMVFGVAGLVWVLPHPAWVLGLPAFGQRLFAWSMAGGGVVYILLGAAAMLLYGRRVLGARRLWGFFAPAVGLSLASELLGTTTGFPFGRYGYLDGLGYKIAGLVPFTIPLSWFYMGLVCFLLAYGGLARLRGGRWVAAVALGALLLMAWDLALDPAMSQTPVPFWEFRETGAFFGMPYRNLAGWVGTGALFMTVAALLWRSGGSLLPLYRRDLTLPLAMYLVNFLFGAAITLGLLDGRYWIPIGLGVLLGVVPAVVCWWAAKPAVPSTVKLPELDLATR